MRRAAARREPQRMGVEIAAVEGAGQRIDQRLFEEALVVTFLP